MEKSRIDWSAFTALLMATFVWASSFIALKISIGPIGPMSVIFGRMLIASFCFLFFIKNFFKVKIRRQDIKYIALMAFFEPCLYFLFEAKALQYTSAGQAGMITSMMPLITAFGAGMILKEVITTRTIIGSILAVSGAIWLSLSADVQENASNPLLGNTIEFLAMICAAGYTIAVRYLSSNFSAFFITAIQAFLGAIFFFPFALWEYLTMPMDFTPKAVFGVFYLGIFVTLGGYGLFNYALGRIAASKAAVYINLIPVFVVILAYFMLEERLNFVQLLASGIILLGVFVSQMPTQKIRKMRLRRRKI
jgi:drug/metabolite transporter (DMT)-like permease